MPFGKSNLAQITSGKRQSFKNLVSSLIILVKLIFSLKINSILDTNLDFVRPIDGLFHTPLVIHLAVSNESADLGQYSESLAELSSLPVSIAILMATCS
jgi:hypothetical protein